MSSYSSEYAKLQKELSHYVDQRDQVPKFVESEVKKASGLQRSSYAEYEAMRKCYKESLIVSRDLSEREIFRNLIILNVLLRLESKGPYLEACTAVLSNCLAMASNVSVVRYAVDVLSIRRNDDDHTMQKFVSKQTDLAFQRMHNCSRNELDCIAGVSILVAVAEKPSKRIDDFWEDIFQTAWDFLGCKHKELRGKVETLFLLGADRLAKSSHISRESKYRIFEDLFKSISEHLSDSSIEKNLDGFLVFQILVGSPSCEYLPLTYNDFLSLLAPYLADESSRKSDIFCEPLLCSLRVLCNYDKDLFIKHHLKDTVSYAINTISSRSKKSTAFFVLSSIIHTVRGDFAPYVEPICMEIRKVFAIPDEPCWEALNCFSVICQACPPKNLQQNLKLCVDNVFRWGLSPQLLESLHTLRLTAGSTYQDELESALLDKISLTLSGLSFQECRATIGHSTSKPLGTTTDLTLALNALLEFSFSHSYSMSIFLRDTVLSFISSTESCIRNAAIQAIVNLLLPSCNRELTGDWKQCIDVVLSKMLKVALDHEDEDVRQAIIGHFTPEFYPFLSSPRHVDCLFQVLNDESILCAESALRHLCRLVNYDVSHILPVLSKVLCGIKHKINLAFPVEEQIIDCLRLLAVMFTHAPQHVVDFAEEVQNLLLELFPSVIKNSFPMKPFFVALTPVAKVVKHFGPRGGSARTFQEEIRYTLDYLDSIPHEYNFVNSSCRLLCFQFLYEALSPTINRQSPYQIFPSMFRHIASALRSVDDNDLVRAEALKCLGKIGALDVTTFQGFEAQHREVQPIIGTTVILFSSPSQSDCCSIVLRAIRSIAEPADKRYNPGEELVRTAVGSVLDIGRKCPSSSSSMHVVIAPLARTMRQVPESLLGGFLLAYAEFLCFARDASEEDSNEILLLFHDVWSREEKLRYLAVHVVSTLSRFNMETLSSNEQSYQVIGLLLGSLNCGDSPISLCFSILGALIRNAGWLQPLCEWVMKTLLASIFLHRENSEYVLAAVKTLQILCLNLHVSSVMSSIVRQLRTLLSFVYNDSVVCKEIVHVFSILLLSSREDFEIHLDAVVQKLKVYRIPYDDLPIRTERKVLEGWKTGLAASICIQEEEERKQHLLQFLDEKVRSAAKNKENEWAFPNQSSVQRESRVLPVDESKVLQELKELREGRVELEKWSNRFCMIVLSESPYEVFRCVSVPNSVNSTPLAEKCPAFVSEIVPLGFRTLWSYSSARLRKEFLNFFNESFEEEVRAVLQDEVVALLLSIVEYMDHSGEPLGIDYCKLSDCAWNKGMLAKAVYWRERAYCEQSSDMVESLIGLYSEVHMPSSSRGIFNSVDEERKRQLLHSSLVKLGRYEEALKLARADLELEENAKQRALEKSQNVPRERNSGKRRNYSKQRKAHMSQRFNKSLHSATLTSDSERVTGRNEEILNATCQLMLCMDRTGDYLGVMGKWNELKAKEKEEGGGDHSQLRILPHVSEYAAAACVWLQDWSHLEEVLKEMPNDTTPCRIYTSIRHITLGNFSEALKCVNAGRKLLLEDIFHIHESYARSYDMLIVAQMLTQLEEVIQAYTFQKDFQSVKPLRRVKDLFNEYIPLMVPNVRTWKQVLPLYGLLTDPSENLRPRISFIHLCRLENAKTEEKFALSQLLGTQLLPFSVASFKQINNPEIQLECIAYAVNAKDIDHKQEEMLLRQVVEVCYKEKNDRVTAKAYVRLGLILKGKEKVNCYLYATLRAPRWPIAFRLFAEANAELLNEAYSEAAITSAIEGYIRSILLGTSEVAVVQDVLKLLTLWTKHVDPSHGLPELKKRVFEIPTRVWRLVVPQLIAHLDSGSDESCQLVADIVTNVSLDYPNTLFFPLNLCRISAVEGSTNSGRRTGFAKAIIKKMTEKDPLLMMQGTLVTEELTRLCSLPHEGVFEKLQEANISFNRKNFDEMLRCLGSLHASLPGFPQGVAECAFLSMHSKALEEAEKWIKVYKEAKDMVALQSAWCLYDPIFKQIQEQLKNVRTLDMSFYSPKLFEACNLVFGLPDDNLLSGECLSKIAKFDPTMNIINSKQRPKRLSLTTSDGRRQKFLLKGKEDLRLDERVMQLFAIINIVMRSDFQSVENIGFRVEHYTVTPLTETVGLIGWVGGCDTLREIIKDYREKRAVFPDLEFSYIQSMTTSMNPTFYERLTTISKIEVLEFLADRTSGQDLRKAMWATTQTCEIWIDQRRRYMTSLGNMSMVGYILGLGDRHPNNIMLQKKSGQIVHIDFGDCFEVTMTREKFPENVPFRLTRMLCNALDVSQLNGAFRSFCETSMSVLRRERDSVLALLQAFVDDPLISWRLVARSGSDPEGSREEEEGGGGGQPLSTEEEGGGGGRHGKDETETLNAIGGGGGGVGTATKAGMNAEGKSPKGEGDYIKTVLHHKDVAHQGTVVYQRVESKLQGKDFAEQYGSATNCGVKEQVNQLLKDATDVTNLAPMWVGWMPFW